MIDDIPSHVVVIGHGGPGQALKASGVNADGIAMLTDLCRLE